MTGVTSWGSVPALEFAGLTKRFGENVAVDHIDLVVPPGSFFGLVGPNGAGKTTSLSMAVGLLRPDGGTAAIFGQDVWADPVAAKALIGVLPDGLALPDRLTGREILLYLGLLRGMSREVVEQRADELLRVLELDGAGGTPVVDYSTGMRKKITLATALLHSPRLLRARRAVRGGRPGVGGDDPHDPAAVRGGRRLGDLLQPRHGAGRAALRPRRGASPRARSWPAGRWMRCAAASRSRTRSCTSSARAPAAPKGCRGWRPDRDACRDHAAGRPRASAAIGILLLALLVTLLAVTTLLAGLVHYRYPGARAPTWWRPSVSAGCSAGSRVRC